MHKYFIFFFQVSSLLFVLTNTIFCMTTYYYYAKITTCLVMLMRIFVPKDTSVFVLDGAIGHCVNTYIMDIYPLIIYTGLIITNWYYSTSLMLIIDNILISFISASSVYIFYLMTNAERDFYFDFNKNYISVYRNIISKKIMVCLCMIIITVVSTILDVTINYYDVGILFMITRFIIKSLLIFHCYQHLLVQKKNQQKKIC